MVSESGVVCPTERFEENAAMYHWPGIKGADIVRLLHVRERMKPDLPLCHSSPEKSLYPGRRLR
jgi:hypothetical protein